MLDANPNLSALEAHSAAVLARALPSAGRPFPPPGPEVLLRPVLYGHVRTPEAHWRAVVDAVAGAVAAFGPTLDLGQASDLADKLLGCLEWQGLHVVPAKPTREMVQASLAALRRHNRVIGGEMNVEEKHKWRLEEAIVARPDWRAARDAWTQLRAMRAAAKKAAS